MVLRRSLWLAVLALVALAAAARPLPAAESSTAGVAHIKLTGDLGETPVASDALFGALGENLKTKLDRIKKAKDDPEIRALYLQIEDVEVGWGKLNELKHALADFRKSGKKTYAYLESGSTKDYLLAINCDEVTMPECGEVMVTGIRAEVSFYKDLLDKVGIQADFLRMGAFKSAVEPFTRSSMSKEARARLESVLDDFYDHSVVQEIVKARSGKKALNAEQVKKLIDEAPYSARAAAAAGLIDRVEYSDGLQDEFKKDLKVEHVKVVRNYGQAKSEELNLSNPFDLVKLFSPSKPLFEMPSAKPRIAVIYATGMIISGKGGDSLLGGQLCGSTTMIEALREAEKDKSVKAIVLRVDSPGGSSLASDLIWHQVRQCKKPVIASMSDVAASGGYYISMGAQKIYAEPGTLTGSIGVFGGKLALGGLYDKAGIKTEIITRGANANLMSLTTPFSESERKSMTALIRETYDQFLNKAIEGRKRAGKDLTRAHLETDLAGGRVWTGRQARENGLVDELGTLDDALVAAKTSAGLKADADIDLLILPKARNLLDKLLDLKSDEEVRPIGVRQLPLLRELPEVTDKFSAAEGLLRLRSDPVWMVLPYHVDVR